MSMSRAKAVTIDGFEDTELVPVVDYPPYADKNELDESNAVVMFVAPFGFRLEDYELRVSERGELERLVPGSVLNAFQRAVWPI